MLVEFMAIDDDIVQVHEGELLFDLTEDHVQFSLERTRSILETQGHSFETVCPMIGCRSGLVTISSENYDFSVAAIGIQGGE